MRMGISISIPELFARVMDQSMFDYRDIAPGNGRPLSNAEEDIFRANLQSLCAKVVLSSAGAISGFETDMATDKIYVNVNGGKCGHEEPIAIRFSDVLMYGMLTWWNSTQNSALSQIYREKFDSQWSSFKTGLVGITTRGFSYY